MAYCEREDCIHHKACYEVNGLPCRNDFAHYYSKADVVPKSEVEDAKIKVVASVISEISKMLKSSYNHKHAFVNDEFLRGRDGAYQEFIDILTEISRKNTEGEK